jgi:hypothetical protein
VIGHNADIQFFGAAIAFKTVEQNPATLLCFHTLQTISNAMGNNGDQQLLLGTMRPHAAAFITQIQAGNFDLLCHLMHTPPVPFKMGCQAVDSSHSKHTK